MLTISPTRVEKVQLQFSTNNLELMKDSLKIFELKPMSLNDGDTFDFTYDLLVYYFMNVDKKLAFILKLIDEGVIVTGDLISLDGGIILIKEVIEKLLKLREKIK